MNVKNKVALWYWLALTIVYAITGRNTIMLIGYAAYSFYILAKKKGKLGKKQILALLIFSIIIPNNYVVIVVVDLLAIILYVNKTKRQTLERSTQNAIQVLFVLTIYALLNGIVQGTPISNYVWVFLYYSPLFASIVIFTRIQLTHDERDWFLRLLKSSIAIQVTWVAVYAVTHVQSVIHASDLDWVAGTFGFKQGNIFFAYCAFCSFIFLNAYRVGRSNNNLAYFIISVALLMSTGSIGLTLLYALTFAIALILNPQVKVKYKIGLIVVGIFATVIVVVLNPDWVINDLLSLGEFSAFTRKVRKYDVYNLMFIQLPSQNPLYALFGAGLAQGTSRAALTGTGMYIEGADALFSTYQSEFFTANVLPYLRNYLSGILGLAAAPVASVLSIQSELGYVGTVLLLFIFVLLIRKNNSIVRVICLFEFLILFWDNYLEFAKAAFIFIAALYYCYNNINIMNRDGRKNNA